MLTDFIAAPLGEDIVLRNSAVKKAGNIVQTQLASLEYAPGFGIDLEFFLLSEISFQNESFRTYVIERLTYHQVNVVEVLEVLEEFMAKVTFQVDHLPSQQGGLIE